MKNKLFIALLIAAGYAMPVVAQNQTTIPDKKVTAPPAVAPKIFKVFSVSLIVDSTNHPNSTTTDAYITETFTYVGTGVVNYTYSETTESAATRQYPNGKASSSTTGTITLNSNGTQVVHIKRGIFLHSVHTLKLTTTSPNQAASNTISY